ncbi:TRAP transporter small permease [Antarctobacter sp.]|uniref:TRAP transporter small permease n=1 Tax=Antarctobacter sp. TaxID=1872577 RepID=UPI003A8E3321
MKKLSSVLSQASGLLVFALVGITAAAVFARYVIGHPFQWTEEFSGLLMVWIVFLAAISCEIDNDHLSIDMVVEVLSKNLKYVIAVAVALASIGLLLTMSWLGWDLTQSAGLKKTQILRISWFWIYLAVVVGCLGSAVVIAVRLLTMLRNGNLPEGSEPSAHDIS